MSVSLNSRSCKLLVLVGLALCGCGPNPANEAVAKPATETAAVARPPAPAPQAPALHLDDRSKASLLALPKDRDIIITSGDAEEEAQFAYEIYTFLKSNGYDLDEPDRLLLTSIAEYVTINMNSDDPSQPIQIRIGNKGFSSP